MKECRWLNFNLHISESGNTKACFFCRCFLNQPALEYVFFTYITSIVSFWHHWIQKWLIFVQFRHFIWRKLKLERLFSCTQSITTSTCFNKQLEICSSLSKENGGKSVGTDERASMLMVSRKVPIMYASVTSSTNCWWDLLNYNCKA